MADPLAANASVTNPADLAGMKQAQGAGAGKFAGLNENTTVRDFMGQLGIDVDGPVTQLKDFMNSEISKGDPLKKMENIAGAGPGPASGGPAPPPMPPEGGGAPGLEGLMT